MNKITYDERREVYERTIEKHGVRHQMNKFEEELGEFLAEYGRMKNNRGNREALAEELADLTIMLEQLRLIFEVNEEVCISMDYKVLRLKKRLREGDADGAFTGKAAEAP